MDRAVCKFMDKFILIIVFWQPQECRFVSGESILMCKPNERAKAEALMTSELPAVKSCLQRADGVTSSMKRAILEVTFTIVHKALVIHVQALDKYGWCGLTHTHMFVCLAISCVLFSI